MSNRAAAMPRRPIGSEKFRIAPLTVAVGGHISRPLALAPAECQKTVTLLEKGMQQ